MTPSTDPAARQQGLIRALLDPRCYPHPVNEVRLLETHISTILLAGDYAYKLKKPLRLDFLDYTALEQRHHYCALEVELNRRRAPELYLDCIPVTGTADAPRMGGTGPVLEYAVRMRRFPEHCRLDHLLESGGLGREHMEQLGRELAAMHQAAPRPREGSAFASAGVQTTPLGDNAQQLARLLPGDNRVATLRAWMEQQLERLGPLMDTRATGGFVRDCHGDLHLANLVLLEGRFLPFDGIEFDDALRWIDVLNDLAFLLMDLDARGFRGFGIRLLNAWLDVTGDHAGLPLLQLYKGYRALVRAKINAIRLQQLTSGRTEDTVAHRDLERYLALAEGYITTPVPRLWVMAGLSGSGKSTIAARLMEREQAVRLRSDVERKRLFGLSGEARTGAPPGGGIYGPEAGRRTYQRLRETADLLLRAGWPVVIDAACLKRGERDSFRELAREAGCPCTVIWCRASPAVLRHRVRRRLEQGRDPSEADEAVLERQLADHEPPDAGEPGVEIMDTGPRAQG
ncbi:MAG: AAA family ATPase [Ectothiorhodospiraceae bacterium]|nr:AAA family ATPase [Ectothiorhodospiraceae bacterium]